MHTDEDLISFEMGNQQPKKTNSIKSIIKVIGVGGGGGNAVENMFKEGIENIDFIIANTDRQVLDDSNIPTKLHLGQNLTEGLGAGNNPEVGKNAAVESADELNALLEDGTKMVFITAGMGGGTGTGAAPVIAQLSRQKQILTIGVVTIPFAFEGLKRLEQAIQGLNEMQKHVDAMLIINNEKISEVYPEISVSTAFAYADKVLTTAVKSIVEIITKRGVVNVDFADVKSVMMDSGVAVMGTGYGEGEERGIDAVQNAINSPLLNNNDIRGAKNLLVNIYTPVENEIKQAEMERINRFLQKKAGYKANLIWGLTKDDSLDKDKCAVTVIATDFNDNIIPTMDSIKMGKIEDEAPVFEAEAQSDEGSDENIELSKNEEVQRNHVISRIEKAKQNIQKIKRKPIDFSDDKIVDKVYEEPAYVRQQLEIKFNNNDSTNKYFNPQLD